MGTFAHPGTGMEFYPLCEGMSPSGRGTSNFVCSQDFLDKLHAELPDEFHSMLQLRMIEKTLQKPTQIWVGLGRNRMDSSVCHCELLRAARFALLVYSYPVDGDYAVFFHEKRVIVADGRPQGWESFGDLTYGEANEDSL